ncbi:MAG TPA: energy transducer TonB [Pyrinomonadaceae bacterium]|jgi:protein TonB|nr:energy transducer TonB [Pyrinomonadaceae bacterium]
MFNNLIESSSHAGEFKRRGSFVLFTTATYVVLFVITGVVSIYAYDAHLEDQATELELLTFVPPPTPEQPEVIRNTIPRSSSNPTRNTERSIRTVLIDSLNPNNPPDKVSTEAQPVPPARHDSIIGSVNSDPPLPSGERGISSGTGNAVVVDIPDAPPPLAPTPTPAIPKILKVSDGVLNGQATYLPKPVYPTIARQARVQGKVAVQILIDEYGKVLNAKVVSGPPLLIVEAQRAAMQARFSPTTLSGQPVKVSGVITYNFVMQ